MSGNIGAEAASTEHRHKLKNSDLGTTSSSSRLAEAKQRSKKAARAAFCTLVCVPFKCLCCVCTSFGGVLMLMRSQNTREFALAVVIGNVFERYCNNVADYVVGPLVRWFVPPFTEWTWNSMAFIRGMEALQLSGGQLYSNPADARVVAARAGSMESAYKDEMVNGVNDPIAAAQADGAIIIQIQNIIDSSIGFVITLLNIYWFFNCIATTERLEKAVKGAYSKGKEVAEKAVREAAKRAQLDALKGMTQQERDDLDNAFAKYDTDGDGQIDLDEFRAMVPHVLDVASYPISDAQIANMHAKLLAESDDGMITPPALALALQEHLESVSPPSQEQPERDRAPSKEAPGGGRSSSPSSPLDRHLNGYRGSGSGSRPTSSPPTDDARWVPLVNGASTVDEGMKLLLDADPATFFLHGTQIREMLAYKLGGMTTPTYEAAAARMRCAAGHHAHHVHALHGEGLSHAYASHAPASAPRTAATAGGEGGQSSRVRVRQKVARAMRKNDPSEAGVVLSACAEADARIPPAWGGECSADARIFGGSGVV